MEPLNEVATAARSAFDRRWLLIISLASFFVLVVLLQALGASKHPTFLTAVTGLITVACFSFSLVDRQRFEADFGRYCERKNRQYRELQDRHLVKHSNIAKSMVAELLPALDNLDRALDYWRDEETALSDSYMEGLERVQQQFFDALADRFGISAFDPIGRSFDPAFHDAIVVVENKLLPPGSITKTFERGYLLAGKLWRPAKVAVTKKADESAA